MVHGSWSMGMRADAHTGPLKLPGHGRHMGPMGNVHGKAYWTANVQAGMCTRVARGVSVALFLLNCAIRQAGQRRVHGACSSVRLYAGVRGHGNSLDGTDARAWDGRLFVRPSALWVGRLRVRRLRTFDCSSVWRAWDGRLLVRPSARVQLRLHVCARATATARRVGMENMGMKRRLRTSDCLSVMPAWENSPVSSVLVRLRLHDAWAWEAWAWKRHGAADGTSARAWDELDLVRLAALVRVVLVDVE